MGKIRSWLRSRSSTPVQRETGSAAHPTIAPSSGQSSSVEQPSTTLFPDGVEILVDPPGAETDVCFVHGLTGNRSGTWTAHGQPWPKTLLSSALPKACIFTYGYDAYIVSRSVASSNGLVDHAKNLLTDLTNDRRSRNASARPLIFVVHSLGGLVCKEAILLSRNNPDASRQGVFKHTKGVVFMGTPHKGSWMADWARIPAKSLGLVKSTNRSLLKVLQSDDQYLGSIHDRFLTMMREQREKGRKLQVACFFEELPLPGVGKVVSKDSATFEGYDPISIHANHADMVKFGSAEDNGFKRVVGELTAWESEIGESCLTTIQPDTNASTGNFPVDTATKSRPHYLPFTRNKNFTGRKETICELQKLLFTHSDGQRAALVGLGGAGKTQIALQLAHLAKNDIQLHQHCSVIWISALSKASFEQACTEMIKVFKIKHPADKDPKETFKDFLGSEEAGNWFLILDNADDMEILYGTTYGTGGIANFIPDCEQGYILLTTRSNEIAARFAQTNILELTGMDIEDARALLRNSLVQKDPIQDTTMADRLLQELAYLPLAITQASAYMNINKVPIKEYLRLLQNTDRDMIELLSVGVYDKTHYNPRQSAVLTTWIVSFKQIRDSHTEAATLLSFVACLEPKAIPKALLPRLESEQSMTRAIGTLCNYSFFSRRGDGDMFDMHSLVHLATQIWNRDEGDERGTQQLAFEHLAEIFPNDDWENREVWRQYMPHALRLLRSLDSNRSEDACTLGYSVAICLRVDGKTRQMLELLEHVVAVRNATLAEDHPNRLTSQHVLAMAYNDNGQVEDAIQLLDYIVAVKKTLPEDHPDRLASQHVLAIAYHDNGQVEDAIQLLEHIVAVQKITLPEDYLDRLASQHVLAIAYNDNGQVEDAIQLLEHVVAVRKITLPEDHPNLLVSQHELAIAYNDNGQVEDAIQLLEHIVAVQKITLPEDHLDRLVSQHELARAYNNNGQVEDAIQLMGHVVAVEKTTLPEGHLDRLASQYVLAIAYNNNGQVEDAIQLLEHVVAVQKITLPEGHPNRLASEEALEISLQDLSS